MADNEPVSPEQVKNAQALANELAKIEQQMGALNEGKETELFLAKQISADLDAQLRSITEAKVQRERLVAEKRKELDLLVEGNAEHDKMRAAIEAEITEIERLAATHEDVIDAMKAERDLQSEIAAGIEESLRLSEQLEESVKTAAEALTGIGDSWKKSATGAFLSKMQTEGFGAALSDVGKGLKENFKLENIAGSIIMGFIQQTMKAVMALDNARSGFAKAMGTGDSYNATIHEVHQSTREFGVDAGEASAATQALAQSMAGFGQMSDTAKRELGAFNAVLTELGVAGNDGAEMLENTTLVLGMTKDESMAMGAELSGLAHQLGIDIGSITSDFNAVMGDLAVYGKEAPQVFKKLVGASQSLGISVDSLVGSMKELDTVTGAATAAGRMNAVLGGMFMDTNELLNASYEERILLIKKGLDASGKDFDSMSRTEKQMVANASGMKDVGELARFMRKDMNELSAAMEEAGDASGSIEEMQERAKQAQSATDKWNQALENLAIAVAPLVDALHVVLDVIKLILSTPFVPEILVFGAVLFFMVGAVKAVKDKISDLLDIFPDLGDAAEETTEGAGKSFAETIREIGSAAKDNAKGLLALGATFILISIGVAIAAYGVSLLVKAFAGFSAGEILAISVALAVFGATMIIMMKTLAAMTPITAVAAKGLLIFGGVMLILGVALVLAAFAFSLLVDSFMLLLPHLPEFALFAGQLMLLAVAGLLMLPGGLAAMVGLILMAVGIAALGLALKIVSSDDLRALADMMQGLGKVAEFAGAGIGDAVPAVKDLFDELEDMAVQISTSVWLFSALGFAFSDIGEGALLASLFLPSMVGPLMMIGAGVVIWVDAMERLNKALPTFFSFIPQWYEILFIYSMLAPIVFLLALSVSILAMTGMAAALGLMMLAWGFTQLGEALQTLPTHVMSEFNTMLDKIESTTDAAIDRIYDLASAFWDLAYVMDDLDDYKDTMFSVGYMLEHTGHAAAEASKLTPAVVQNVDGLVTAAQEYSEIKFRRVRWWEDRGGVDQFVRMLQAATGQAPGKSGGSSGDSSSGTGDTVVLELDGVVLGRTIEKILGKRNKLTTIG